MPLRLYLDECVDHRLATFLSKRGHEVLTAQAAGMLGAADDVQLRYATERDMPIVSHNQRHFRIWHASTLREGRSHAGIVLVPFSPLPLLELRAAMLLDWVSALKTTALSSTAGPTSSRRWREGIVCQASPRI